MLDVRKTYYRNFIANQRMQQAACMTTLAQHRYWQPSTSATTKMLRKHPIQKNVQYGGTNLKMQHGGSEKFPNYPDS